MKRFLLAFCSLFAALALLSLDAEAARLGGGRSFGMQRSPSTMPRQAAPTQPAAPTAPTAAPAKPAPTATPPAPAPQPSGMSRWLGPIAGLAAGIGLAALLSHFGMGEGMASMLMIVLLVVGVVMLFRLFMRKPQAPEYAGAGAPARFEPVAPMGGGSAAAEEPAAAAGNIPADFDVEGFLRNAKLNFVRLQAANDAGNVEDIRQFTTPEVFAEVKLQIGERGGAKQQTDVVQLHAQLLDVESEEKRHVASVRFYGLIREDQGAPGPFDEVWHLSKPTDGSSGWVVAGIQQVQ